MTISDESWVALPRSLARELYCLPHVAFKYYFYLYLNAGFNQSIGKSFVSKQEASEFLGVAFSAIDRATHILETNGLIRISDVPSSPFEVAGINIRNFRHIEDIISSGDSFVPLSRGLNDHLRVLTNLEFKILIYGIVEASFIGKRKGLFGITARELAKVLGSNKDSISAAINSLIPRHIEPHKLSSNRYGISLYRIKEYKTVEDFLDKPHTYRTRDGRIPELIEQHEEDLLESVVAPWE